MSSGSSKGLAIAVLAIVAGIVAAMVAMVISEMGAIGILFVGFFVAALVAIFLMLAWREAAPAELGARDVGPAPDVRPETVAAPAAAAPAGAAATTAEAKTEDTATGTEAGSEEAASGDSSDETSGGADGDFGMVKASAALSGQEDLAARKGTWRYDGGDGAAEATSAPTPAPEPEAKPEPKAEAASGDKASSTSSKVDAVAAAGSGKFDDDADMSGSIASGGGTRPAALDGPRDGKADDLKQIKGVGPKMEKTCNALGFYHFDQIAAWTADEVAWVDQNLEGFKGRVTRDSWVAQAKVLAEGGETEFSKKVEKGGVY